MDNEPQPEYIDDWNNPESGIEKQKSTKQYFFDQFCYQDQSLNFIASTLSAQSRQEVTILPYDPKRKYLTVHCGLNIKGTCQNKNCIGYHKNVWVPKGYDDKINFSQARFGNNCPCCNTEMEYSSFKTLGFKKARVTFQGARLMNNKAERFSGKYEEKVGKFVKFKDYDEHVCEWIFLNIKVQKN